MLGSLSQALGSFIGHAGRLLRKVLGALLGLCALGLLVNGAGLWLVGTWTWATLWPVLLVAALSLPAYLVVGWRSGLSAALDEAWRTLGAPLREEVASRVVAQLGARGEQASQKLVALADTASELRASLAGKHWLVRIVVELLLARVPWAQALDAQALREKLAGAGEPAALQRIVREQLDRIELPSPLAWLPWALVGVHALAMGVCVFGARG